ncbi:GFA family protein [Caulobacter sp. KR2-114]|uniref:GFA family protein n=1 Tax=Caulobacter sp. KR2-114 TaxID=3400912 RepID=UPI003BFCB843
MSERWTGGCQCGAVRFAVEGPLGVASICHCRMCQKATGGPFGPYVNAPEGLTWSRGEPKRFQSSNRVKRGFCPDCGTPLTFEWNDKLVALAIGAFDDPSVAPPTIQFSTASRVPWFEHLASLPVRPEDDTPWIAEIVSYQHPDHD